MPGSRQGHCDGLSRLPLPSTVTEPPTPAEVVHLLEFLDASPVTVTQVRQWTARDPVIAAVLRYAHTGWAQGVGRLPPEYKPCEQRVVEQSCSEGFLLWGGRVVILTQCHLS